jgi:hypothetical protein
MLVERNNELKYLYRINLIPPVKGNFIFLSTYTLTFYSWFAIVPNRIRRQRHGSHFGVQTKEANQKYFANVHQHGGNDTTGKGRTINK